MSDEQPIAPSSDEHLLLARILERRRSKTARAEVNTVLESGLPIKEKLQRIEAIDRKHASSSHTKRSSPTVETERPDTAATSRNASLAQLGVPPYTHPDRVARREIHKRRISLKRSPSVGSFWDYIFRQARQMRDFNRSTQLLSFGFLSLRPRINPQALHRYRRLAQTEIRDLHRAISPILEDGWLVLTKVEYNLIAVLVQLCNHIEHHSFSIPAGKPHDALRVFSEMERDILILLHEDRDGTRMTGIIGRYYASQTRSESPDVLKLGSTIAILLDTGNSTRGVAALVRALNMVATGRYLEIDTINAPPEDELIPTEYYDCDIDIGERIAEYLTNMIGRVPLLSARIAEVSRLEVFLRTDGDDMYAPPAQFAQWSDSDRSLIDHILQLNAAFRSHADTILDGTVGVANGTAFTAFDVKCFGPEINRFSRIVHRLERVSYDLPGFPMERFLKLHREREESTTLEREAISLLEDFSTQMIRVGGKLGQLIRNRRAGSGTADSLDPPWSPVVFLRPFYSADMERIISDPGPFSGISIFEALTRIAQIAILTARYLEDRTLINELRESGALRAELDGIITGIHRIADSEVYEAVRNTWIS